MKVLVVDDEQPARERLTRLLQGIPGYEIVGEAANGHEAIDRYNALKPEIILLDIRMPGMDGLETARHLMADETPPAIIFTTAYGDHALEAFDTHAVGYLLKPVRTERLEEALQSAQRSTRSQLGTILTDKPDGEARNHICVRLRGNLLLVPVSDIFYFRAEDKYVTLQHCNGSALIEDSLVKLETEFAGRFLRIHRNALVAIDRISGLKKLADNSFAVTLKGTDEVLDISRRHLAAIRRLIKS
ncbi:MAG TPA: LytTR family DNA-binding domain-containing protein [Gammaproteobacteria bacterium]